MRVQSTRRVLPGLALFLSGAIAGAGAFALVRPAASPALLPHASTPHADSAAEALFPVPSRPTSRPESGEDSQHRVQEVLPTQAPEVVLAQAPAEQPPVARQPHPDGEEPALPSVTRDARELLVELRHVSPGPERDALVREALVAIQRLSEEEQGPALRALDEVTALEPVRTVGAPALGSALKQVLAASDANDRATRMRAFLEQVDQLPEGEQRHWLERLDNATAQQAAGQDSR